MPYVNIHYNEFDITKLTWEIPKAQTDKNGSNPHHTAEPMYEGQKNFNIEFPELRCGGIKKTVRENGKEVHRITFALDRSDPEHLKVREILKQIYESFVRMCSLPEFYTAIGQQRAITPERLDDLNFRPSVFHPVTKDPKTNAIVKIDTEKDLFLTDLICVPDKNFYTTFNCLSSSDPKKILTLPWDIVTPTEKIKLSIKLIPLININRFMITTNSKSLKLSMRSAVVTDLKQGEFLTSQKDTVLAQTSEQASAIATQIEALKLLREEEDISPLGGDSTVRDSKSFSPPNVTTLAHGQVPQSASSFAAPTSTFVPPASNPSPMMFNLSTPATTVSSDLGAIAAMANRPGTMPTIPLMGGSV